MSNQQTMRSRIRDELVNEKLTDAQVDNAIITAIRFYRGRKLAFNQILDTLTTVAGTEWYTTGATVTAAKIKKLLWANIAINSLKSPMKIRTVEWIDQCQSGSLQSIPWAIASGRQQIRLYPIPDAVYTIQFFAHYEFTEPSVAGNSTVAWFTDGEELIRNAAMRRLAISILQAPDLAAGFAVLEQDALSILDREHMDSEWDEELRPEPMGIGSRYGYDINVD